MVGESCHAGVDQAGSGVRRLLGWAILVGLGLGFQTVSAEESCAELAGVYAFAGQASQGNYLIGRAPNIAAILFPDSDLVYDEQIDRYAIAFENGRVIIEFYTPEGPLLRLDLAENKSFSHCTGAALVIEQQRQGVAGSVYEYSRHRHTLSLDRQQGLLVDTEITGKYQNRLMAWPRERERRRAHFDKLARGTD
jgi:hypothetical protein